jgi:predicted DNA-binding transcriptional regulator AlpA
MPRPYTAREICEAIGISLDTLYRTREHRHARDALPRPITEHPLRWERSGFDAWLTRYHPARPPAPANDVVQPPAPAVDDEHRARLRAAYAPQSAAPPLDIGRQRARG